MPGGIGEHRLEPLAGGTLALALVLRSHAGALEALDEVVAQPLQVGQSDYAPLAGRTRRGSGLCGVGGKAPLEARDLIAQRLPCGALVAACEYRDVDDLGSGGRIAAACVEDARQVAGVDAGVAGGACRRCRKRLDRG